MVQVNSENLFAPVRRRNAVVLGPRDDVARRLSSRFRAEIENGTIWDYQMPYSGIFQHKRFGYALASRIGDQ
jgi:hypothetical protein